MIFLSIDTGTVFYVKICVLLKIKIWFLFMQSKNLLLPKKYQWFFLSIGTVSYVKICVLLKNTNLNLILCKVKL